MYLALLNKSSMNDRIVFWIGDFNSFCLVWVNKAISNKLDPVCLILDLLQM